MGCMNTSIVFTGDIGFDKYMDGKWEDEALVSEECLDFLRSGKHLCINVEGPLSVQEKIVRDNGVVALTHSMNPEVAKFFDKLGADIWNINNNHIMDAGEKGIRDTLAEANNYGVKTIGAGLNLDEASKPLILEEAGGIGLVSIGYERACRIAGDDTPGCLNFSRMDVVKKQIELVKKSCRWCVVIAHDGEEFTALPMPYTRDRYMEYLDLGADIIVAHHPHVPMNYETLDNGKKAIFYSLGNFIFDTDYQRSQFNTEFGLFLKLNFTSDDFSFEPFGIKIDRNTDHIIKWNIPDIFADVREDEYKKLLPLAAKMFIENTKRQLKYLKPDIYTNATEEEFKKNFYEPLRSGRVPGKLLDMQIVYPLSLDVDKNNWEETALTKVKDFMLEQIK
ncbi:MAG: CapA family protein [Lachnospiraceae bacterium]|nr:CapA family protein [Lachnospiraceae bacterium]